jgi:hypothetical protein
LDAIFNLDVYNDETHPQAKVTLSHSKFQPTGIVEAGGGPVDGGVGGFMIRSTEADRKLAVLTVRDPRTDLMIELELSVDQLRYAAERL